MRTIVAQSVMQNFRILKMNINQDFRIEHSCSVCGGTFNSYEESQVHSCTSYLKKMINALDARLKIVERGISENRPID